MNTAAQVEKGSNGNGHLKANGEATRVGKEPQGVYLANAKERFKELDRLAELLHYHGQDNALVSASKSLMCVHYLMRESEGDVSQTLAIGLSDVIAEAVARINALFAIQAEHEAKGESGPALYALGI